MKIQKYHYENIYWNEGEQKAVCSKIKYYQSIGYADCETTIDEKGIEWPRNTDSGGEDADYCTQIHKVIFPKNW